jgi:hypothetical protein
MEHRAWRLVKFEYPPIPTMIGREERSYLHWLGKEQWSGAGCVVEIGPWLGGSTVSLATGMIASGHPTEGKLRVFDNFIWREFMKHRADLPLAVGDSFEPFFLENVAPWVMTIRSTACALPDELVQGDDYVANFRGEEKSDLPVFSWDAREPVEILFLDGAKSWRGLRWLLLEVHASLLPGKTLLVCQDFKDWVSYWVPAILVRLREHLEPVHNVLHGDTVAFRLRSPLPREVLAALEDDVALVPTGSGLADLDRAAGWLIEDGDRRGALAVELSEVSFLAHQGRLAEAVRRFEELRERWPVREGRLKLDRAREYLEERAGKELPEPAPSGPLGYLKRMVRRSSKY